MVRRAVKKSEGTRCGTDVSAKFCSDLRGTGMTAIGGASVAVTGAASGIGRALALELAARSASLALADRDEAGLMAVSAEIGSRTEGKTKVTTHRVDVG